MNCAVAHDCLAMSEVFLLLANLRNKDPWKKEHSNMDNCQLFKQNMGKKQWALNIMWLSTLILLLTSLP